jgi:hypothetical protein
MHLGSLKSHGVAEPHCSNGRGVVRGKVTTSRDLQYQERAIIRRATIVLLGNFNSFDQPAAQLGDDTSPTRVRAMSAEAPTRRKCRVAVRGSSRATGPRSCCFPSDPILTAAGCGWLTWLRNSETLVFAVGEANGPEARFAARLATVRKNNSACAQIVLYGDNAKVVAARPQEANLRYCAPTPGSAPRPRLAILEHDLPC